MTRPTIREVCGDPQDLNKLYPTALGLFLGVASLVRDGFYKASNPNDVEAVFIRLAEIQSDYDTEVKIGEIMASKKARC